MASRTPSSSAARKTAAGTFSRRPPASAAPTSSTWSQAATGINLWAEWAKIEIAGEDRPYHLPNVKDGYAGLALTLSKQEQPDTSSYTDAEIVYRVKKKHHAGLIVASEDPKRVDALLDDYTGRFLQDFYAYAPAPDSPTA